MKELDDNIGRQKPDSFFKCEESYSFSRSLFAQREPASILSWIWDWSHPYRNAERGK